MLRSRLGVVPIGSAWRAAIPVGVEPAMPMVAQVLRLNRYRLAGELVGASTRSMLNPPPDLGEQPRLPMLPVGPMLRWLVGHENSPELKEHLAALVDQEVRWHDGPFDRAGLLAFWDRALPGVPLGPAESALEQLRHPMLTGVLQVAMGASGPGLGAGVAQLLPAPARAESEKAPQAAASAPASEGATTAASEGASEGASEQPSPATGSNRWARWWRRWIDR